MVTSEFHQSDHAIKHQSDCSQPIVNEGNNKWVQIENVINFVETDKKSNQQSLSC